MSTAPLDRPTNPTPVAAGMKMKAIVQDAYGSQAEDVLSFAEIARPTIGDGEILVRVAAASVDRGTWHVMSGLPYPYVRQGSGSAGPNLPTRAGASPGRSIPPART